MDYKLYDYQKKGVDFLINTTKEKDGAICGDDMGLGKTVQAIEYIKKTKPKNTLIVLPSALAIQWYNELKRFAPKLKVLVACRGDKKTRKEKILKYQQEDNYDILIVNYAMLRGFKYRNLRKQYKYKTKKFIWDLVIGDEAHRIKNNSKQSKGFIYLPKKECLLLSGSPVLNEPTEIFNLLKAIDRDRFSSYWSFVEYFCNIQIKKYGKKRVRDVMGIKKEKKDVFNKLINQYMIRREKEDELKGLPKKTYNKIKIDMGEKQRRKYKHIENFMMTEDKDGDRITVDTALTKLLRLRQVCLSPKLLNINDNGAKIKTIKEIIEGLYPKKVIIFTMFSSFVDLLDEKIKYKTLKYHGGISKEERDVNLELFKKSDEYNIFLGTIKTAGVGLNLQFCNNMIIVDKPYSPMVLKQAEDRVYRNGQKNRVNITYITTNNSVEEDINNTLKEKTHAISDAIAVKSILKYMDKRKNKKPDFLLDDI